MHQKFVFYEEKHVEGTQYTKLVEIEESEEKYINYCWCIFRNEEKAICAMIYRMVSLVVMQSDCVTKKLENWNNVTLES